MIAEEIFYRDKVIKTRQNLGMWEIWIVGEAMSFGTMYNRNKEYLVNCAQNYIDNLQNS